MGDRGNIAVQDGGLRVWFYTHGSGYNMPEVVRAGLAKGRDRWNAPSYLARIIFGELTKDAYSEVTGFGISTTAGDNGYPYIIVDCDDQQVKIEADASRSWAGIKGEAKAYSFSDLAGLPSATWQTFDTGRKDEEAA